MKAEPHMWWRDESGPGRRSSESQSNDQANDQHTYLLTRPELLPCAVTGILQEIVTAACDNTEAVPSSVAINTLSRFSATIGRTPHIQIGDQTRPLNFNLLTVGSTATARKGTSNEMPRQMFRMGERNSGYTWPLRELTSLSSGEGLIHQTRDARYDDSGKCVDVGVTDKRLLISAGEFGQILAVASRKENPLSMVIRDAFDGITLTTPTKTSFEQATNTHIVVNGSITETELVKLLTDNDISNGLANRFGMFYSARRQLVAHPKQTPPHVMKGLSDRVWSAVVTAANHAGPILMDDDATEYWEILYESIHEKVHAPAVAKLLGRQDLYARIFAALIALINGETTVTSFHLDGAMAWMKYWEDTVNFVFSTTEKNETMQRLKVLMDQAITVIGMHGGRNVPHTIVAKAMTNNYSKNCHIKAKHVRLVMEKLQRESPPRIYSATEATDGQPVTTYTLEYLKTP